jgi:hypothetical protein
MVYVGIAGTLNKTTKFFLWGVVNALLIPLMFYDLFFKFSNPTDAPLSFFISNAIINAIVTQKEIVSLIFAVISFIGISSLAVQVTGILEDREKKQKLVLVSFSGFFGIILMLSVPYVSIWGFILGLVIFATGLIVCMNESEKEKLNR